MISVHFQRADAAGEKLGRVRMPHAPRVGDEVSFGGADDARVYRVTGVTFAVPPAAAAISTEQPTVEDVTVFLVPA